MPAVISLVFVVGVLAQTPNREKQVRQAVESFYAAFNAHGFGRAAEFTTEDWNHINPFGGWTRGREAVLKELKDVHATFLKGVSDTIEDMSVRFATPDVAVVTATSRMSTYIAPDGVKHENERHIRTFAIVGGGEPPFPTLRLSRLNDLPGNLRASQPEDAILETFNRSKDRPSQRVSRLGRAVYPR